MSDGSNIGEYMKIQEHKQKHMKSTEKQNNLIKLRWDIKKQLNHKGFPLSTLAKNLVVQWF